MRSSWEKSRIKGIQKQIYRKAHLAWNHRRQADPSSRKRFSLDLSSGRVDWEESVSSVRGESRKGAEEEGKWEGMEGDWSRGRRIHPTLSRTKSKEQIAVPNVWKIGALHPSTSGRR
jgi:hypothetical protein